MEEHKQPTKTNVLSLLTEFLRMASRRNAEVPLGPHRFNLDRDSQGNYSIYDLAKQSYPVSEDTVTLIGSMTNSLQNSSKMLLK